MVNSSPKAAQFHSNLPSMASNPKRLSSPGTEWANSPSIYLKSTQKKVSQFPLVPTKEKLLDRQTTFQMCLHFRQAS